MREILDRYAGTINGAVGADTIRTADELSAGITEKERNARARCRNEINASLNTSRLVTANHDMMFFERLVAGDFEGLRNDYVPRMREIAQTLKNRIPNLLHRKALSAFLTQMTASAMPWPRSASPTRSRNPSRSRARRSRSSCSRTAASGRA